MRVLALDPGGGTLARCAGTDGIPQTVETALLRPLQTGAVVLVRGGIALAQLDLEWAP
jgi:hydrogenase maturation factor